jgi:hypothetical protein
MTILNRELWALLCIWKHSWWNWNVRFWNSRFVLFVNKFMARVLNVASVPLITMQCVLQGQGIAWRWVALAPLLSKEKNNKLFFIWEYSFTVYFELLLSFSIGRGCIISLSLSLWSSLLLLNYLLLNRSCTAWRKMGDRQQKWFHIVHITGTESLYFMIKPTAVPFQ